ncbi:DUF4139 domain-containing protein [Sphingobacterium hungaricum]
MNKFNFFCIALLLIAGQSFAQKPIYTQAKVNAVNVYRNSAELQNTVSFSAPKGVSEIVIGNISQEIDQKTLQIAVSDKNTTILSSQYTEDYTSDFDMDLSSPQLKQVKDSITIVENLITKSTIELDANMKALELLDKNQTVLVGSPSSSVQQLTLLTEFYTNKRIELSTKIESIKKNGEELQKRLNRLKSSLKINAEEEFANGVLVLKIMNNVASNTQLSINYLALNVSWQPFYEIKGNKISDPLDVLFKALVKQATGLDWKGVKLTLINGFASKNNSAPIVEPWFLYPQSNQMLDEVVVVGYGERVNRSNSISSNLSGRAAGMTVSSAGFEINSNELNVSYSVDIPYDVLSNNQDHLITLYQQQIPVEYSYFSAPNYSTEAYLLAKIKDFSQYGFVTANASIVFENMYVGETQINPNQTDNELNITLGNDRRISIKRENVQDKSGEKFLSSFREKTVTYDLVLRNNKKENISIEIQDRIPLSTDNSVKVELIEHSNAKVDAEKGFLNWKVSLAPSETKKIRVSYKVRSPKDMIISGF